tara:strand:- start:664 stop:951 length:288 start_codon:yes stop_codon:yes gene_type:complete
MAVNPEMLKVLMGENMKVTPIGLTASRSGSSDIAGKLIKPALAALISRRKKDAKRKGKLADAYEMNPSSMKSWSDSDMFGFGGGYSPQDIPDDWA